MRIKSTAYAWRPFALTIELTCMLSITTVMVETAPRSLVAAESTPKKPPEAEGKTGLDKQLLDSLQNELLEGADDAGTEGQSPAAKGALPDSAGEDVGPENEHPLSQIGKRMRVAGEQMEAVKSKSDAQALQQQIVRDLEKLIRELEKECARCNGGSGSQKNSQAQTSQRGSVNQPKAGNSQAQNNQGSNKPAQDSTTRVGKNETRQPGPQELTHLIRDVWGQLPERARERLLQSPPEEFLPKYEVLIEKYYRRLAESPDEK